MTKDFFTLSQHDRRQALEYASERSGRPAHLLEKDIWVVWALQILFASPLAAELTFKGGTSLSKAYKLIDRFSEDVDLTCDIRKLIPELAGNGELPTSRSQSGKWTQAVRRRLPEWIKERVQPVIEAALTQKKLAIQVEIGGQDHDKLFLHYPALSVGTGYVTPIVTLEFGGRATGEPHQILPVVCDMAEHLPEVSFPAASPCVMSLARTFWEKATAAHVYCVQGRIRGERYARHWYDLAAIARSAYFSDISADHIVATAVTRHKSYFFVEKDSSGNVIEYAAAAQGHLHLVPEGQARAALAEDYAAMLTDRVLLNDALSFERLMLECAEIESTVNKVPLSKKPDISTLL
ncbi:hypothetical protein AGMMS50225_28180 [Betaproteobacteria bacterium]|nr:hypothetical protein AGMMS50225_28180 [Betaproteobacteria bacterium]